MYIYMYVCICIHTCTNTHIRTCMHTYIHTCIHAIIYTLKATTAYPTSGEIFVSEARRSRSS